MKTLRQLLGLTRRAITRTDHALAALVGKADAGIVGFVELVERGAGRIAGSVRRGIVRTARSVVSAERSAARKAVAAERSAARKAVAAEQAVVRPVRRTEHAVVRAIRGAVSAVRTVLGQLASEVAAVCGAVFRAPGRLGRAGEALVAYWTGGIWHFLGRIALWVTTPIRKRVAKRAKRQALESIAMTPDHKSHRELLVLLAAAGVLVAGALVLFGRDWGVRQPGLLRLETLAELPGWAWHRVVSLSPLKLTLLLGTATLAAAATAFWFRMLRDSYRRDYPTAVEQTQWRLVTTLLFIPGAVLYFFKQYNRLSLRKFAARHVVSLTVSGVTVLVATSTYGTLWYFNQRAAAEVEGAAYQAPEIRLDPDERRKLLSRDRYGAPLKPATSSRRDPFAPIPGEDIGSSPAPTPSPSPTPES
ncbi:MAG: hypothetical protein WD926_01065 [Patescibacteria group bacterium]